MTKMTKAMPTTDLGIIEVCAEEAHVWTQRVGREARLLDQASVQALPAIFARLSAAHEEAADWIGLVSSMHQDPDSVRASALTCISELWRYGA